MLYAHNSTQTKPVLQLFIWYHDNATLSLFTFTFTRTGSAHFLGPDTRLINVSVVCEPDWCVLWTRLVCTVNQTGLYQGVCSFENMHIHLDHMWMCSRPYFCPHIGVGMYIMWCIIVCFVILNLMCKCDDKCVKCYICLM